MPLKTNTSPQSEATRNRILLAAIDCFADKGLAATTTREIASRANVTQPLLHHYFGSKTALFDEVLEVAVSDYFKAQSEQWRRPIDDLKFWTIGLSVLFRWLGETPKIGRLVMWARLEGRTDSNKGMAAVFSRVRLRFEHAKQIQIMREDVDIDMAMLLIDSLFKGFWDRQAGYAAYSVDQNCLIDRFLAQSLRTLLVGFLTPEAAEKALTLLETHDLSA